MPDLLEGIGPEDHLALSHEVLEIGEGEGAVVLLAQAGFELGDHAAENDIGIRGQLADAFGIERAGDEARQLGAVRFQGMAR